MSPEAALILCRFLTDGAAILLWGTSAYVGTLMPAGLAALFERRLRPMQVIAIGLMVAMTVLLLPLRAATIGNGWNDARSFDTIRSVLFETNVGTAWAAQFATVAFLVVAGLVRSPWRQQAIALAAALTLCTMALSGHAAMNDGWLGVLHRGNDALHLLSGGAWLGSLVPVIMLLPYLSDPGPASDARLALARFSTFGHGAVALVIVSGVVNMLLIIDGPPLDWSFPYQAMLFVKIILVAVMVCMAIINRYAFVPLLADRRDLAMTGLVFVTLAEITVGVVVVGLVAWLGTLEPN